MSARWLLFDVEGTITSLEFVRDQLFPYARAALPDFLRDNAERSEVRVALTRIAHEIGVEPAAVDAITAALQRWIDEDRKQPDLKELQGLIWEEGYRSGAYRGHVYPDVLPFWKQARTAGSRLAIYSSGSVRAQQLLLQHSVAGDISGLIDRHFDTVVGPKAETASYTRISALLGTTPAEIAFFSDSIAELDAARAAGLQTCRVVRPGVAAAEHTHPEITDFSQAGALIESDRPGADRAPSTG